MTAEANRTSPPCFVQFMHPGGEWGPEAGHSGPRAWNLVTGGHGRKFVWSPGTWLRDGRPEHLEQLAFWCEWEAPSRKTTRMNTETEPQWLHQPWLEVPRTFDCLQNTDPCVFGGFFYTGCRQHRGHHPTRLHDLAPGSVIAFGSSIGERFRLDTVFVVAGSVLHDANNWEDSLKGRVPDDYLNLTIRPWYADCAEPGCTPIEPPDAGGYRLYFGATYDHPVDGMFSFFPASTPELYERGFPRPAILGEGVLSDAINGRLQAYKVTVPGHPEGMKDLWEELRRQVVDAGLGLGIAAELPESRPAPEGGMLS